VQFGVLANLLTGKRDNNDVGGVCLLLPNDFVENTF